MNRKSLIVFAVAAIISIPLTGSAVDMSGKYGFGYFNTDAPVGGRIWLSEKAGLDVGLGLKAENVYMTEGEVTSKETATSFWLELGVPYVVVPTERANFFVRPGFQLAMLDDRSFGTGDLDTRWTQFTISATLGAEVFFGDHFSLEAGHGLAVDILSVPDEEGITESRRGESEMTIRSFDAGIAYLGFHFYFK